MTALLSLLSTYAIFFYLAGVLLVLLGIKMLFDARRAGRTTLFTLEQEQASDRAFRAVLVMLGAIVFIGAVAGINAFVGPVVPTATPDIIKPTVPAFTPPVILPTSTPAPTEVTIPPTSTVGPTSAALRPTATLTVTVPAGNKPTATSAANQPTTPPTAAPPTKSALIYPQPPLNTPPEGDSIGANNIRFSWGFNQAAGANDVPENLPPDQFYRVVVLYTSKSQNKEAAIVVCTHQSSIDRKTGLDLTDYRGEAADGNFKWNVTAVRSASQAACESGDFAPLSPVSVTSSFRLP